MSSSRLSTPLVPALLAAASGCALSERLPIEDPNDVATADIRITLAVDARSADEVGIVASLTSPVGAFHLAPGDAVTFGDTVLLPTFTAGRPVYERTSPTKVGPTSFVVRRVADAGVEATVDLPAPPSLTGPTAPVSRRAPLAVSWPPAPDGAPWVTTLRVKGDCIATLERRLAFDGGAYTIAAGDLVDATPAGRTCALVVSVERAITVSRPGFYATARQARSLTVESTP